MFFKRSPSRLSTGEAQPTHPASSSPATFQKYVGTSALMAGRNRIGTSCSLTFDLSIRHALLANARRNEGFVTHCSLTLAAFSQGVEKDIPAHIPCIWKHCNFSKVCWNSCSGGLERKTEHLALITHSPSSSASSSFLFFHLVLYKCLQSMHLSHAIF